MDGGRGYSGQGPGSDCYQHSSTTLPLQQWACVEWTFAEDEDRMQLWLDGAPLSDVTVVGRGEGCVHDGTSGDWVFPSVRGMRLGWIDYQTRGDIPAQELWIDDVAVANQRVGCPSGSR